MGALDILRTTTRTTAAAVRFCARHGIAFDPSIPDGAHTAILYTLDTAHPDDARRLRKSWHAAYARAKADKRQARYTASGRQIACVIRDPDALAALRALERKHGGVTAAVSAALVSTAPA